jgi:hypothetical protein
VENGARLVEQGWRRQREKPMAQETREQRLAAKLRENLKRRKQQARMRSATQPATGSKPQSDNDEPDDGGDEAALKPGHDSDS